MNKVIRFGVVGVGYWGPNLIRNISVCPGAKLVCVCDSRTDRLERVSASYPSVDVSNELETMLARQDIDVVVVATPVSSHASIAIAAMNAGKDVLVEKPMAGTVEDALRMLDAASRTDRILMVDHTYLFHPAVRKIKEIVAGGGLGDIYYIDGVRINLGLFQHDVNVVWDLAPHDLAILEFIVERGAKSVRAVGASHTKGTEELEDVAYIHLDYGEGLLASIHVNWLSPVKVRHFIIGGSKKSIVYNDLDAAERVKVYDSGITVTDDLDQRRGVLIGYRTGDVWIPKLESVEPLQSAVLHFVDCVKNRRTPISDGELGLRVVRILEATEDSLRGNGRRIDL